MCNQLLIESNERMNSILHQDATDSKLNYILITFEVRDLVPLRNVNMNSQ